MAESLDRSERTRLNRRLLERTLRVVAQWQGFAARCVVVSGCVQTLHIAGRAGAMTLLEPRPRRGLNSAVAYAVRRVLRSRASAILVLPSDLPRISVGGLNALVRSATYGYAGAIAPDAAHAGTNALLLKARGRFDFCFGIESRARHIQSALARGWRFAICAHPDLALDIDLPEDLMAWRKQQTSVRRRMV